MMTTPTIAPETQAVPRTLPPVTETPQLDERLWQGWLEKNERLDQMRFARRVRIVTILVVVLAMAAVVRGVYG
jgi:hypothetical protein